MFRFQFILLLFSFYKVLGERRIVDGDPSLPGQFPYVVSFQLRDPTVRTCSGSIISDKHILTAAHCLVEFMPDILEAVALVGTNFLGAGGKYYKLKKAIYHSNYSKKLYENDISIIKIRDRIQFNENTQKINLSTSKLQPYSEVILVGWGGIIYTDTNYFVNYLTFGEQLTLPSKCCAHFWKKAIGTNIICAFSLFGQRQYTGDSGAPLVYKGSQIGIASFSKSYKNGFFDVYTKVSDYIRWIQQTTKFI